MTREKSDYKTSSPFSANRNISRCPQSSSLYSSSFHLCKHRTPIRGKRLIQHGTPVSNNKVREKGRSVQVTVVLEDRLTVRGNLLSDDPSGLPYGAQISVSLVDVALQDVSARPLNSVVLYGSYRFPIAYEIPYTLGQIQNIGNSIQQFAIQARIEKDGQLLYINDQYTPVRLLPAPINPVNVIMKRVSNSNNAGNRPIIASIALSRIVRRFSLDETTGCDGCLQLSVETRSRHVLRLFRTVLLQCSVPCVSSLHLGWMWRESESIQLAR